MAHSPAQPRRQRRRFDDGGGARWDAGGGGAFDGDGGGVGDDDDDDGELRAFNPSSQLSHSARRVKVLNDPIYGHLELESHVLDVIDTPPFQRLRDCKQLGLCDHVFPGTTHTRFEHSIGVSHLAERQMAHLNEKQPALFIDDDDDDGGGGGEVDCQRNALHRHRTATYARLARRVQLGALCHDLGHGPLGHIFDLRFLPQALGAEACAATPRAEHEHRSVMVLRHLVDAHAVDLPAEELRAVEEIILGGGASMKHRPFLYEIVANKTNSLDVDKFDYLQRDTHSAHVPWGCDPQRLIQSSRVIGGAMAYHAREVYTIYDMFTTRFKLHKVVYNHRAVKAVELMAVDALLSADSALQLSRSIVDAPAFLRYSDSLLYLIRRWPQLLADAACNGRAHALADAQALLERIQRRQLYKFADELLLPPFAPTITEEDITTSQGGAGALRPEDIVVYIIKANHGMGPRNPVDNVRFYNHIEDASTFRINARQVSYVMPEVFEERIVRVYSRSPEKLDATREAFHRFVRRCGFIRGAATSSRGAAPRS